jgi:hypothetical protein
MSSKSTYWGTSWQIKLWLQLCSSAFQDKAPMDITRWVIGHVSIESTEPPRSIALQSKTSLMSSSTKIHKHRLLSNQRCRDHGSPFWLAVLGAFSWICIPPQAPYAVRTATESSVPLTILKAIRLLAAHCIQPVRAPVSPPLCA